MNEVLPYVLTILAGLGLGTFVNIMVERFPHEDKPLTGPYRCVKCNAPLKTQHMLPLLGYFLQAGKCYSCHKPIPWRFPATEIFLATMLSFAWAQYAGKPLYVYLVNAFYIFLLTLIGALDWRYRLIFPVMIWLGCVVAIITGLVAGNQPDNSLPDGIGSVVLGAALCGGVFYLIYLLAIGIYKRRALGFGDVQLAILIGASLGFPRSASALFLGVLLGGVAAIGFLIVGGKRWREFIPYGTTLCLGVVLVIVFGQAVWRWGPFGIFTELLQLFFKIIFQVIFGAK